MNEYHLEESIHIEIEKMGAYLYAYLHLVRSVFPIADNDGNWYIKISEEILRCSCLGVTS